MHSELPNSPADFRTMLRETMHRALLMGHRQNSGDIDAGSRVSALEVYADLPDEHIIYLPPPCLDTAVFTTDADQYIELLKQAAEIALGDSHQEDGAWLDAWTREVEKHERAHGLVSQECGNDQTITYYGIQWIAREDGTADFQPGCKTSGPIRKVHFAYSAMAPDDDLISPADIRIATELGYDITDIAGLRTRSEAVPKVPEDYDPNLGVADLVARMILAALRSQS